MGWPRVVRFTHGVRATSANRFASWRALVPTPLAENTLVVQATDRAGNVNAAADTVLLVNRGPALGPLAAVEFDAAHDRAVLVQKQEILAWDFSTRTTRVLSGDPQPN